MTLSSLKRALANLSPLKNDSSRDAAARIHVDTTTADEVIAGVLSERSCCLLVMPGGRDLPYVDRLRGKGNENISRFVRDGGSYLGICAGAYYGCSSVQFAQGDPLLEVVGPRELSFFKGISQGPVFAGFDYTSNEGALAADVQLSPAGLEMLNRYAPISSEYVSTCTSTAPAGGEVPFTSGVNDPHMKIYYNGGCHFMDNVTSDKVFQDFSSLTTPPSVSMATYPDYKVLATYSATNKYLSSFVSVGGATRQPLSTLIASRYGRGKVVLSGVHFEASCDLLEGHYEDDPYIESILPDIASSDTERERLLTSCIAYLLD